MTTIVYIRSRNTTWYLRKDNITFEKTAGVEEKGGCKKNAYDFQTGGGD
jgi:hypothetical protein